MTTISIPIARELGEGVSARRLGPILVATDGRRDADSALRAAQLIAARSGAAIEVVSVIERIPVASPEAMTPAYADAMAAARAEQLTQVRTQMLRVLGETAVPLELMDGTPAAALSRRARDRQASLIIVGLGRHTVMDRLFGSETAMHLLRLSPVPVLAVPPIFSGLPKRVISAMDFSDCAIGALQIAFPILGDGALITATHVISRELSAAIWESYQADYESEVVDSFRALESRVTLPRGTTFEQRVLHGDPVPALLHFARVSGADLVVTGTHGHNFFSRMLLGSVATGLVRGAEVAVLAVPKCVGERVAEASAVQGVPTSAWVSELEEFTKRNTGRRATVEIDDPELGAQAEDVDYPLLGTSYDRRDGRIEIMLGELGYGGRHVTRSIGDVSSIDILRDRTGRDVALRIQHGNGQTVLTLSR